MRRAAQTLLCAAVLCLVTLLPASAQQHTVGERTYKRLTEVQALIESEDYAQARAILDEMSALRINDYERALMHQLYGLLAAEQDDYAEAVHQFELCLALESLPDQTQISTLFNVAQLYLATERFDRAARSLEVWFHLVEDPNPSAYYALAISYYQLGRLDDALLPARLAIERAEEPKEAWLQLLVFLHIEQKQYDEALPLLERLAALAPKKAYWMQLSAIYGELGREEQSLAVQQLAYEQGVLTERPELERLAQMYLYHGLPHRAAAVMEQGFEGGRIEPSETSYKLLADAWLSAREYERAVEPLAQAAELAPTGSYYSLLARIHMENASWSAAIEALHQALRKGGLDDPGAAHLLLGISHLNDKHFEPARDAFTRASQHESTRDSAMQWLNHLEQEQSRHG